jgi:hypothetical protein
MLKCSIWKEHLPSDQYSFDNSAFLLHLLRPDELEMTDGHRLSAMQDLLKEIEHEEAEQDMTETIADIELYTDFFRQLLPKMQSRHGNRSRVQLDRFLKSYGNREVLWPRWQGYPVPP